jgi:hypothetical protein
MIHMNAHPDGSVLFEDLAQLRRYALGEEYRNSRANTDELHMFDRAQAAQQMLEFLIRQQQRIAT